MIRTGREVSRIEGFSDAVFGFALTLLVVSLEVPDTFAGLRTILTGFVPFGLTFALVCWIWYEHYAFFRKFDAEDPLTIALNCLLLFLVLFFVYPLKFVFARVVPLLAGQPNSFGGMTQADARLLMWVYSAGFAAVFAIFTALYWNTYRRRASLSLTELEAFDARAGVRTHLISVAVGLLSAALAFVLPIGWLGVSGMIYALQAPLHWRNGVLLARAREQLGAR